MTNRVDSSIDRALEIAESLPSARPNDTVQSGAVGLTASGRPVPINSMLSADEPDTRVGRVAAAPAEGRSLAPRSSAQISAIPNGNSYGFSAHSDMQAPDPEACGESGQVSLLGEGPERNASEQGSVTHSSSGPINPAPHEMYWWNDEGWDE